jgi:hypothetical protein
VDLHVEQPGLGLGHPSQRVAVDPQELHQCVFRHPSLERCSHVAQPGEIVVGRRADELVEPRRFPQRPDPIGFEPHLGRDLLQRVQPPTLDQ